jgi:hypothetical protein
MIQCAGNANAERLSAVLSVSPMCRTNEIVPYQGHAVTENTDQSSPAASHARNVGHLSHPPVRVDKFLCRAGFPSSGALLVTCSYE